MGLSIGYKLKVKTTDAARVRDVVRSLHEFATTLPVDEVSPVEEYAPPDGRYVFKRGDGDDEGQRWKPGAAYLERPRDDGHRERVRVPANHVVCFHVNHNGAETASFGLASHPPVVLHRTDVATRDDRGQPAWLMGAGEAVEVPTRLRGWYSWSSGCKTQYAGNPKFGGPDNFLRAHLSVFGIVDHAKSLGLTTRIRDDGKYWRHRDEAKLLASLAEHDVMIAGFAGRLSDALGDAAGGAVVAPIKDRPDFEHLEAAATVRPPRRRRLKPNGS